MIQFKVIYNSNSQQVEQRYIINFLCRKQHVTLLFKTTNNKLFGYCNDLNWCIFVSHNNEVSKLTKKFCNRSGEGDNITFSFYFEERNVYLIDTESSFLIYI
ncbi:hypothetical protein KM1_173450 [Entamoeba histolytica HM-3:IMSS]|uniref:Uncharacterized protein n=4 Tax=Entamoeba histolytica TaxID=5759 RepID=C4M9F3_ENTH1|nr:hypothetical protein EHI_074790 [Entamoeba histolytica HM-1:IMSS]EAL44192.1 hypothetical protein EHI_074790 [Entamoeba histolytica HM-1:IMSS]EMS14118.1 hypothetical protein KM1_173450 [Entamoeba histolytica HM-3:IMSS]ENY61629.1 hypothetical protein EHI7A_140890 [Entamoeba histolytica HM-1:IMSS-A]GAT98293.1 hypothetical protein CL6EHI_074790 [Entamoeba histolytica]|eukprot:XP_649578.1 hypothetical protein EHI_074790 [Entamoeba histolytica HM-1:IMSS]